jgi:hypothetical protein
MSRLAILLASLISCIAPPGKAGPMDASSPRKATYALVVNAKNAATETGDAAKALVKKLYLKDLTQWTDRTEAKPYSREAAAAEQVAFVKDVLGMNDAELARHWLKIKNMNGSTPPKEVDTDRMMLKYIAKYDGAFGVVKVDAARDGNGVKILFEF